MNNAKNTQSREQMLIRSCLESAPGDRKVGELSFHGAGERSGCTQLHHLKQQALYGMLRQAPSRFHKRLCGAANVAAELAWDTDSPVVMFPRLFEAMARSIYNPMFSESSVAEPDLRSQLLQEPDAEAGSQSESVEQPLCRGRRGNLQRFIASGIALALGAAGLVGCIVEFVR